MLGDGVALLFGDVPCDLSLCCMISYMCPNAMLIFVIICAALKSKDRFPYWDHTVYPRHFLCSNSVSVDQYSAKCVVYVKNDT